jgi:hypothetical protein
MGGVDQAVERLCQMCGVDLTRNNGINWPRQRYPPSNPRWAPTFGDVLTHGKTEGRPNCSPQTRAADL